MMKLLTTAAFALVAISSAQAAPVMGTFAGALGVTTPGVLINVGTTLDLNNGIATSTGTGDLGGVGFGTTITGVDSALNLVNGETFSFTLTGFGSFLGTQSAIALVPGSTANNRTVRFFALGDFTPTFGGFDAGPASFTGSFTQTGGADAAVSFSFTFASPPSPPPVDTPTPAALALFGLGLAGLGLARRAR